MQRTKSFESLNYGSSYNSKASQKETYLQMQVYKRQPSLPNNTSWATSRSGG